MKPQYNTQDEPSKFPILGLENFLKTSGISSVSVNKQYHVWFETKILLNQERAGFNRNKYEVMDKIESSLQILNEIYK